MVVRMDEAHCRTPDQFVRCGAQQFGGAKVGKVHLPAIDNKNRLMGTIYQSFIARLGDFQFARACSHPRLQLQIQAVRFSLGSTARRNIGKGDNRKLTPIRTANRLVAYQYVEELLVFAAYAPFAGQLG